MRASSTPSRVVRFGVFQVDLTSGELRKHGARIRLQDQPRQILSVLLETPGDLVTREDLCKRLWPGNTFVDFDHSLNTAVMRLREALSDSPENPRFIETVPRHGYCFIAPVEETSLDELPAASKPLEHPHSDTSPISAENIPPAPTRAAPISLWLKSANFASRRRIASVVLISVAAAAIIAVSVLLARTHAHSSDLSKETKSIVVLPLENLSEDKDQQYFADGMTDELIAHLAKIRSLRVISRTSAMEYKGSRKPLSEIARELKVDAVVEGTVLRSGNRVRITAELIQVATDRHLWAETYESQLDDVLSLQNQVASAIVNEIRITLTPHEQEQLATVRPVSAEGYEDYLRGRYYWNKRSEEGLTRAIHYFELATQKDPQSALAYAGLADCYSIIGSAIVGTVPSQEVAPKARAAALRALQLDDSLAESQTSLATVLFNYDWDWAGAAKGFRRAIELNPSYATAYQRYSLYLMAIGETQQSIAEINRARQLDPVSISTNFSLGWRLYMARRYEPAIEQLRNTVDMDPSFALPHLVLGQAYEMKGSYDLAIAELRKAATISNQSPPMLGALGQAYAAAGHTAEAQKVLFQLLDQSKSIYVSPFYIALVYTGLGDKPKALASLEKAYADRSNAIVFLKVDPQLDSLRSDPRFQSLQHRLALPN
jgi:TolB-like protein/DNA-binding winged helix-turn-helix (wHTH) protein/tetratricopeptide (TPR) repeat protein